VTSFSDNSRPTLSIEGDNSVELLTTVAYTESISYIRIFSASTSDLYANNYFLPLTHEVYDCSAHTIEYVGSEIELSYDQSSNTPIYISLSGQFVSTHQLCPITSYTVNKVTGSSTSWISFGDSIEEKDQDYFENMKVTST
jgi:GDP-D-mannose dehydratase